MRIQKAAVSNFVRDALLNVRSGLENAQSAGVDLEMPKEMSFTLDIVDSVQSLATVTETVSTEEKTETSTREAAQNTTEGGGDTDLALYSYDSFETD